ncbi:hypothetical protein MML48_7g00011771 [Holotrichia oblita]|uniref:Uncharacterized protein n=1 Tax=Holotrichia oblita TaxID=644536 RepID=A0ACB9STR9_HOLOL|nr:hypothetical protein MML48_7g00011771 [Holotrichia oblita]
MSQAKRKRAETSRDPNIWLQWLNELSDEEKDYDDESDDEEEHENKDKTSEHDSDSLQEFSETEEHLSDEEEEGVHQNNNYFVAVDKKNNGEIKWSKEVPNPTRTRSHNIILHLPGSKGDARNAKSETDCLKLFISDSVISMISESTNIYIQEQQHNYGRDRDCRKVDEREIRAYIVRFDDILFLSTYLTNHNKMERGFEKASSDSLPAVDLDMITAFFATNSKFLSTEIRNVKTYKASKTDYGDKAIGYVQLKRDGNICIVNARIAPEHKIHSKQYKVSAVINETEEDVISCECIDCAAAERGCKHAVAFLMWLHRRSEEVAVTSTTCYWKKPALAEVGQSTKYATLAMLTGKTPPPLEPKTTIFHKAVVLYDVVRSKRKEGYLPELIMGASRPFDISAMSRGRQLEPLVLAEVEKLKKIKLNKPGFLLNRKYPIFGTTPDGIFEDYCVEVKCPSKEKTVSSYVKDGQIITKYYMQIQMQMYFAHKMKGLFCVAAPDFETTKVVDIYNIKIDKEKCEEYFNSAENYWIDVIYPLFRNM